jgi:serine/threonine protein kinase/Tfp pilus assembly protein PilF
MNESRNADIAAAEADRLAAEVVAEITDRLHAGEHVDVEAYIARHPQLVDRLHGLVPALEMLDRVASSTGSFRATAAAEDGVGMEGMLGDFRLVREVGRGGMGVVYEAEQVSLQRRVALKVLPFAGALDARQLQRFRTEARAAAQLHHTNIVPVYFVGCERGVHFYAMQYIEGRSLAAVLAELREFVQLEGSEKGTGPLPSQVSSPSPNPSCGMVSDRATTAAVAAVTTTPRPFPGISTENSTHDPAYPRAVARLGEQAALALDYAHRQGIVHRDVKPANLLVDGHGNVWVTDFGLAQVRNDVRLTATGDLVGTLRYMSPEQALSQRSVVDHRTDIYSLGATLYEMLTQQPVFGGNNRQYLLRQIAFDEPLPPRRLNTALPAELEIIVLKALAKNPDERYATAQELADDLRNFLDDKPIRARRPGLRKRLVRWARRHKPLVVGAAVFVLTVLLLGGIGLAWQERQRADTERSVTEDLREADMWRTKESWADARQALERAEGRLAGSGPPYLRAQIGQMRDDVCLAPKLEEARLQLSAAAAEGFDFVGADAAYAKAFREHHLDVTELDPDEAAERIRASAIRTHIVVALDNWSSIKDYLRPGAGEPMRTLAGLADDDSWRQQLRSAAVRGDPAALTRLAERPDALAQPPANLELLSAALLAAKAPASAERLLRHAQKHYPADFWISFKLADLLRTRKPALVDEAIGFYRAALAVRPKSAVAYNHLGISLWAIGKPAEAEAACRQALAINPNYAGAYNNLGLALVDQDKFSEAVGAYKRSLELKPDCAEVFNNLGVEFYQQRKLAQAEDAHRQALLHKPDFAEAYNNLGLVLSAQGKPQRALDAYQQALALRPDYAEAHANLAWILICQGKPVEAAGHCRQALAVKPNLGGAHFNLGVALLSQGCFADALVALRRVQQLGCRKPGYNTSAVRWVRLAERLAAIESRLPRVITGEYRPVDARECIILARICHMHKGLNATAARLYGDAFAAAPMLDGDAVSPCRYDAACSAALAGCGRGTDADMLDSGARTGLRRQALAWLRTELAAWRCRLDAPAHKVHTDVCQTMKRWQCDPDLADVRDPDALAQLPTAERRPWRQLWQEVELIRQQAAKPGRVHQAVR